MAGTSPAMTGRVDQSFRKSVSPGSFADVQLAAVPARGRARNKTVLAARRLRPRLAHHAATKRKATKPGLPPKREAERRKAHCPTNVRVERGCALLWRRAAFRRSRLRHSPPAS